MLISGLSLAATNDTLQLHWDRDDMLRTSFSTQR
jgi:hypothetical protein